MKACQIGFNPEYQEENPTIDQIGKINGYAVLEFGTPWCGHCEAAIPSVRQVLSDRQLPHIKVVDGKGKALGRSFKVKLWPTLILLNSGKEIARLVRPIDADEVKQLLEFVQQ
jgi:thioredoxin 1